MSTYIEIYMYRSSLIFNKHFNIIFVISTIYFLFSVISQICTIFIYYIGIKEVKLFQG